MEGKIQYNLKPGSIPTIFNHSTTSTTSSIERQNKEKERRQKLVENAFEDYSRRQKLEKEEDKEIKKRKKIMEQYWFNNLSEIRDRILLENIVPKRYVEHIQNQRKMDLMNFKDHNESKTLNSTTLATSLTYHGATSPTCGNLAGTTYHKVVNPTSINAACSTSYIAPTFYPTYYNVPTTKYNALQTHEDVAELTTNHRIPSLTYGNIAEPPNLNETSTRDNGIFFNNNVQVYGNVAAPPIHYIACSANFDLPTYNNILESPIDPNFNPAGDKKTKQQQQPPPPKKIFVEMNPISPSFDFDGQEKDQKNQKNIYTRRPVGVIFVESALAQTSPYVTSNVTSNVLTELIPNITLNVTSNVTPDNFKDSISNVTSNLRP